MQRTLLLFLCVLLAFAAHSQTLPNTQWQKSLGGSAYDNANTVIHTMDSCYLLVGATKSTNGNVSSTHGNADVWVVKLSPTGSVLWEKTYGGSQDEYGMSAQQTPDSGYIIASYSLSSDMDVDTNRGVYDAWVLKISKTGLLQWSKSYGGTGYDVPLYIRQTSDGGYVMAGWSTSNNGDVSGNHGDEDAWVVKLSSTGAVQWQKSLGGSGEDHGTCVIETAGGGYLLSGFVKSNDGDVSGNHGTDDLWVVRLSAAGSLLWQKCYGGSGNDKNGDHGYPGSLQQTLDGGYILSGWSNSNNGDVTGNHGDFDNWIIKLNDTGALTWQKSLGGTGDDEANCVLQTRDTGYIVAGLSNSNNGDVTGNHGGIDMWVVKLSSSGNLQWQKTNGGPDEDIAFTIRETRDTGYVFAGYTRANGGDVTGFHGDYDMWVVKVKMPTPVVINAAEDVASQSLKIVPNPTDGFIKVIGVEQTTSIQVFNISGALLKTGLNTKTVSIQELPSGVYFVNVLDKNNVLLKQERILKK